MTFGDLIAKYRAEHGLTMQEFADRCGFSRGYISMLESGTNYKTGKPISPSLDRIKKIADVLGMDIDTMISITEDQLVTIGKQEKGTVKIPVYSCVAAGIPNIFATENIVDEEEIEAEAAATGDYFGLKIKGDSMTPRICEGDTVIVRKQPTANNGQIVIALINGDYGVCKKFKKGDAGITLISLNPAYDPLFYTPKEVKTLPVIILGVVVELRAKFV